MSFHLSASRPLIVCLAFLLSPPLVADATKTAADAPAQATVEVDRWLTLGPSRARLPAFHGDKFGLGEWLAEPSMPVDERWPVEGGEAAWPPGEMSSWRGTAAADGILGLDPGEGGEAAATWLAVRLEADRFVDLELEVTSAHLLRVLVDGEEVASKSEATGEPEAATAELHLDAGHHLLLVLAVRDPSAAAAWTVAASVKVAAAAASGMRFTTDAARPVAIDDFLRAPRSQSVDLSRNGEWVAVAMRRPAAPTGNNERWIDIFDFADGRLAHSLRGASNFAWSRAEEDVFAYSSSSGDKGQSILLGRVGSGEVRAVTRDLENLAEVHFADADTLILVLDEPAEADERPAKRYRDLPDRWSNRRNRSHLYAMELDGARSRLTVGGTFEVLRDIHPAGDRLLLTRETYDRPGRPFSSTELIEIDLRSLEPRTVVELGWFSGAAYSPSGDQALVLGSAALFDAAGAVLEGRIANDYDTQAYLLDLSTAEAKALSRDFDPSIQAALWPTAGRPHLRVEDRSWQRLVRLDVDTGSFETLDTGVDSVHDFDATASRVAWVGSGVNDPHAVWVHDGTAPRRLVSPGADRWAGIKFGDSRTWTFTSSSGDEILGRVYLPPGADTDTERAYPLIVYYYGGTSPVGRSFGGRYPKEWWAAQGYVVYVMQPSGSTGFGQEFSARHVNAWGRQTADDILEGTRHFLDAHPFVDPGRVGAIGASYGGFMTLYLQTRSKLFAAAVSHAGISNLASYWGKGWWGYLYSDAASAGSFPWNARDLYVEQSPLYHADKVTTPILLLHGDADVNVPPVESHQMYTALKVLGREVELIEIAGADHQILDLEKRRLWSRTILAWFDRYLKDQPEMWQHLWGTDDEPKG